MSPTISGPVLVLVGLYFLIKFPNRLATLVVFFVPFSATSILNFAGVGYKSGGLGVTPASFYVMLFFIAQFGLGLAFRPLRVSAGLLIQVGLIASFVVLLVGTTLLNAVAQPLTAFQITQTVYVLFGFAVTVAFAFEFAREGVLERVIATIRASAVFVSAWGLLQLGTYVLHIPYPAFLFNNSLSDFADMFNQAGDGFLRIASVAVEPSFFASSMLHFVAFGLTVLIGEPRLRIRAWVVPVGFATFVLVLSTSTTAYFGLAVLALLLLLRWPIASAVVGAPICALGGLVVLAAPKVASVLASMTVDKSSSTSYLDRTAGAIEALRGFLQRPIFGGGWSSAPNFNSLTATLANVGAVGGALFILAGAATLFELQSRQSALRRGEDWRYAIYAAGVQNALLVAFACSVSSGIKYVVLDDFVFWALGIALASRMALSRVPGLRAMPRTALATTR